MSNYLEDKDLEFLKDCANEDLKALADLLVFDKDGKKRWNEKLSGKKIVYGELSQYAEKCSR